MLNLRLSRGWSVPLLLLMMLGCSTQNGQQVIGTAKSPAPAMEAIAVPTTGNGSCKAGSAVDAYLGTYTVVAVEKYSGGLTTEAEAKSRAGQVVVVSKDTFIVQQMTIARPSYRIACYPIVRTEGEVPVDRWSYFYGFGSERSVVEVLYVEDPELHNEVPEYYLEVVRGDDGIELWDLSDGWFYRLTAGA